MQPCPGSDSYLGSSAFFLDGSLNLAVDQRPDLLQNGSEDFFYLCRCDSELRITTAGVQAIGVDEAVWQTDGPSPGCAAELIADFILPVPGHDLLDLFLRDTFNGVFGNL